MNDPELSVRARFERFPASVKGAFVLRGDDADPHQVVFHAARVVPIGSGIPHPVPMKPAVVQCPPHQDMFLPFELSTSDLGPGWYGLECDVDVDGSPRTAPGGRFFVVAWPRGTVRRGPIDLTGPMDLGPATVTIEQADGAGDHVLVRFSVAPARRVSLALAADDQPLPEIEFVLDAETGSGSLKTYPLLKAHTRLRLEATARGGRDSREVALV